MRMRIMPRLCRLLTRKSARRCVITCLACAAMFLMLMVSPSGVLERVPPSDPPGLPYVALNAPPSMDQRIVPVLSAETDYCQSVNCKFGEPCMYPDEVDLRIIILTYNRAWSLEKALKALHKLETFGHDVRVHVWIDRSKEGKVDEASVRVAKEFASTWKKGHTCVHVQPQNAYIIGQWVYTWRPRSADTKEIGLITEDDVDIAPLAYRWLHSMRHHYGNRDDVMGYTLQMEQTMFFDGDLIHTPLVAPREDPLFFYPVLGTWAYAPHPRWWREFQDWFQPVHKNTSFHPYVGNILPTRWFKEFEAAGTQDSMWDMWYTYFCDQRKLYCVYSNLVAFAGRPDTLLCTNRHEKGLHDAGDASFSQTEARNVLLTHWRPEYASVPEAAVYFDYDGKLHRKPFTRGSS